MKPINRMKIILILLLISFNSYSQNRKGYFDISKDEFYYEKMSSWKEKVYDDYDCEFKTTMDNDSILIFSAKNFIFKEEYQLTLNKQKKIKKIEVFFTVHNGKLENWFPIKYPIKIGNFYKNIGTPSITKENVSYSRIYNDKNSEFTFKKYYKWNNALYRETKIELEVGQGIAKLPIRNKRGKIKKYRTVNFGYFAQTPKGKGSVTADDINFNVASKVSDGVTKTWNKNTNEIKSLLDSEFFETSNSIVGGKLFPYLFFIENTNDPKEYFTKFFFIASSIYNIEFGDEIFEKNQKYTYTTLPDGILAKAIGMDKDCCIEILIDLENWNKSTYLDKIFIMFHEFGHDIFGLEHSDGIRLMTTNKLELENPSIFGEMFHEMMLEILKKQQK